LGTNLPSNSQNGIERARDSLGSSIPRSGSGVVKFFSGENGEKKMNAILGMIVKVVLGVMVGLVVVGSAAADTVYTYTGNTMNGFVFSNQNFSEPNCNCSLSGTVDLNSAMVAVSWSFTDGTHTLTNLNSSGTINPFDGSSTPFATWSVSLTGGGIQFFSQNYGSHDEATDFSSVNGNLFGYEEGNPGKWTTGLVATTEPATGLLLGLGLAVAGLMRRRRKKTVDATVWESLG
jgi:hypothetical protein